jgi:hypothetical protein
VPRLATLLETTDVRSYDGTAYVTAESLVSFLLTRGDEKKVLRFAVEGQRTGWVDALRSQYDIGSHSELQRLWEAWLVDHIAAN